ncbi:MAG: hypothetical protein OEW48_07080, partial [Phycisphaerae bacterium]|nr:hypothetical protein [Phycisphaerae bacterium]
LSATETISSIEVPEPSLDYLKKLTDSTGLFQHAKLTIPNRDLGYTTDDNARAVIAMADYYSQYPEPEALKLFDIYLSFILHSQNKDGTVKNFMNFDRSWRKNEPANDALGRVLWAFGTVMARPPSTSYLSIIKDSFDKSVQHVKRQYPRGTAYSIFGMSDYLKQFPGASDIKRQLDIAADELVMQYEENSVPDWQWFEDILTYDNAVLPHALFVAGMTFDNKRYLEAAQKTCEFLLDNIFNGEHFSFVGCNGWFERGHKKTSFDQQPIEAVSTVMMLRAAYDATQDGRYLTLQRKAFDWFLGANDLYIPLYNFRNKGCYDGLTQDGINLNQGAESILSFLLSILAVVESYASLDKVKSSKSEPRQPANSVEQPIKKKVTPIKSISAKDRPQRMQVEKLT